MSQNNGLPVVLALICTGAILGGGYWWLNKESASNVVSTPPVTTQDNTSTELKPSVDNDSPVTFNFPTNVPSGTTVNVNGSTSMVQINQAIKKGFESEFSGTAIATNAQGTEVGIELLQNGQIDIAAISRPLTDQEKATGLNAVPIAKDTIAIVVGVDNPFRRGLRENQVADIFRGEITNWSEIGGEAGTIQVINRPPISGTRQVFQDVVLNDTNFGNSENFTTLDRDATTPILRALERDGISYATYAQVANQQTVRTVAVDGLTPEADNYPYSRVLYYVYREPITPEVEAFLGYILSPQGRNAIATGN